jgi:hypothetical protein
MPLASLLGLRLVLWMGRSVPLPAPPAVLEALDEAEVRNDADGADGFQLTFTLAKTRLGDYGLVGEAALQPLSRVVIGLLIGAVPAVLIDGVVTHHQTQASSDPGGSRLTVTGRDLTQVMDLNERDDDYPNQPDWLVVTQVISRYAQYGLVPAATPTADIPLELLRVTRQHETDLAFVRRLGAANGYVFYAEPVTFGVTRAYWGPEVRAGAPQPALTVDQGEATNVAQIDFANDALAPEGVAGMFIDPIFKRSLPLPQLPTLRVPPLAAQPGPVHRTRRLRTTANQDAAKAAAAAGAAVSTTREPISASGQVDGVRYGQVLRARGVVGVRGAGVSHDGFYYVRRVTHRLREGSWTQSFSLSREGTYPLSPVVST